MASKKMDKMPAEILAEDADEDPSEFEPDEEFPTLDELRWETVDDERQDSSDVTCSR